MLLEDVDGLHFRWTVTCPACLVDFGGVIHKEGWLQYDPTCPNCKRMIAGFTNPEWPPLPETGDVDEIVVSHDVLCKLRELQFKEFAPDTCFDYVDSLIEEGGRFGAVVFIEPLGDVAWFADSWEAALDWWIAVLEQQPPDWDYILAGSHLFSLQEEGRLPDDPAEAWKLRSDGVRYSKAAPPLVAIDVQIIPEGQ